MILTSVAEEHSCGDSSWFHNVMIDDIRESRELGKCSVEIVQPLRTHISDVLNFCFACVFEVFPSVASWFSRSNSHVARLGAFLLYFKLMKSSYQEDPELWDELVGSAQEHDCATSEWSHEKSFF